MKPTINFESQVAAVEGSKLLDVLLLLLCVGLIFSLTTRADVETGNGSTWTSLIRVLANPEKYDGKRIQLAGYFSKSFESVGLFLSKTDARVGNIQNAIWVNVPERSGPKDQIQQLKRGYVNITGTFHYQPQNGHGHMGVWPAELKEVTFLQKVK
jgi:hypothetical protein